MNHRVLAEALGPGPDCPPPETHFRYFDGDLEAVEARRLEQHLETCASCRAEARLAADFAAPAEPDAAQDADVAVVVEALRRQGLHRHPTPLTRRRSPWQGALPRFAAAAAVVLTLGVAYLGWRDTPPALPDAPTVSVTRGSHLAGLAPRGELDALPRELSWSPVEGAERYRVTLRAVDDRVLWQTEVREARSDLPAAVIGLSSAVRYFWQTEAIGADQQVLAVSELAWFRARPPARDAADSMPEPPPVTQTPEE